MLNIQLLNPQIIELDGLQQSNSLTPSQVEKIVNIAGIVTGDALFYAGLPDEALAAAVTARGARFLSGKRAPWSGRGNNGADVALCYLPEPTPPEANRLLGMLKRYLRPGGRAVMWMIPDQIPWPSSLTDHFLAMAANAGFTSMIVGRLTPEAGSKMVVATGILNQ